MDSCDLGEESLQNEPCWLFGDLSDNDWLTLLIESTRTPLARGMRLPGFPAEEIQRQFVGSAWEHTLVEAYHFYRVVKEYALEQGLPLRPGMRILDFGCGWGRMARFFLKDVRRKDLWGVDVDPTVIEFCRQNFGPCEFHVVKPLPPVDAAAGTFDIVYAYSVFSHLSERAHLAWLEELRRILRPEGMALITTHGRQLIHFCAQLAGQASHENAWHASLSRSFPDPTTALRRYDDGEFLHAPTGGGDFRPSTFYGETLIPREYMERVWTRYFELLEFRDDPSYLPQPLAVLRKR
jgi:SAM-dependent methyltransferase